MQEILVDLITNLVVESSGKKSQKVLFRRCETISEKLLSHWLSLCLYPHLKEHSGYPLYLLYKTSQVHMEAGPIDAITNDTKYTLSDEKLLKEYQHQPHQGTDDPVFEANCLTLNILVDNSKEFRECRILDCDTITQVKDKCLTQIYINYPASRLKLTANELVLEWHAGRGGKLRLSDEDNTSKRDGDWVRLNTLAHYNVQDGSHMALIDPQAEECQQNDNDSVNANQILLSSEQGSDGTTTPTDSDTTTLVSHNTRYWHMVKPEAGDSKPQTLTDMLYRNRLLTFKQSILEYVRAMYNTVLKEDTLPPHVHFLYSLFDELRETYKIEAENVHAWKSESYPIRIWATLMRKPATVFDISTPPYVDTTMEIISRVFIECFSKDYQDATKDSTTHKLMFNSERAHYRAIVKRFYKDVCEKQYQPDVLRNYLEEVNQMQMHQTGFNKDSALYKLYQQLEPYMLEVIDDLSTNTETCRLRLDGKLEEIKCLMDEGCK